ncbi:hypothetical protein [Streptomyces sp. NPDC002403]
MSTEVNLLAIAGRRIGSPPVQYASTFRASMPRTANGLFSDRGSMPAGVAAAAAFFTPGRRDVDVGLVVCVGRYAAAGAVATGPVQVFPVVAVASGAEPVDRGSR